MVLKDEATNFNNGNANTNNFKSFKYKAKLLENIVASPTPNQANGILKVQQLPPCHEISE